MDEKKPFFKVLGLYKAQNKNGKLYFKGKVTLKNLLHAIGDFSEDNATCNDVYFQIQENSKKQQGEATPDVYLWLCKKQIK